MATRDSSPPEIQFTTNEHDQREAARLQDQLCTDKTSRRRHDASSSTTTATKLPSVEICNGAHKYVQITASSVLDGTEQVFVVSRKNAAYHRNAAEPFLDKLRQHGYQDMQVTGGGRVDLDESKRTISIYGFSYGFGKANHEISADVVRQDERYRDYNVTWSDEGY